MATDKKTAPVLAQQEAGDAALVQRDQDETGGALQPRYEGGILADPAIKTGYSQLLGLVDRRALATRLNEDFALISNNRGAANIEPGRSASRQSRSSASATSRWAPSRWWTTASSSS